MNTISLSHKKSLYESILFNMLSRMEKGTMNISLPSGQTITFGNGEGNVSAAIQIKNQDFFKRCVLYADIGFGEAYMDGDWDTDNITNVIKWFLLNVDSAPNVSGSSSKTFILGVLKFFNKIYHLRRKNSVSGSQKNISEHYDLNNDFFSLWLDPSMTYSCALFKEVVRPSNGSDTRAESLEEAQTNKYERLCQELRLKPTDHVLEIGSGWGGNAIYMAKNYGCKVTSITISKEQQKLASERVEKAGLNDKVKIEIVDYRDVKGQYDKIVSIEMLEAVGDQFLDIYFKKCHELLKKDGILAFQVITCPDARYDELKNGVDWIQKHIFPGSLLPSVGRLNQAINSTGDLTLVDLKDMGLHYVRTLSAWRENFNKRTKEVLGLGFDEKFIRKWNYYLSYCEAAFAMRNINVMQMVYARPNNTGR